jgi:hypothetical protein
MDYPLMVGLGGTPVATQSLGRSGGAPAFRQCHYMPRRWDYSASTVYGRTHVGGLGPLRAIYRPSAREVRCRDVSGTKQVELRPRSAIRTPSQGRSGGPRLHASTTASLHPGSGVVLSRGPKCIAEAAWRRLTRASDMGPPALNMGIMRAYSHEWQVTCALH